MLLITPTIATILLMISTLYTLMDPPKRSGSYHDGFGTWACDFYPQDQLTIHLLMAIILLITAIPTLNPKYKLAVLGLLIAFLPCLFATQCDGILLHAQYHTLYGGSGLTYEEDPDIGLANVFNNPPPQHVSLVTESYC